ncbi:hypothetical protein Tco_0260446 [Tanacetum coccineum]
MERRRLRRARKMKLDAMIGNECVELVIVELTTMITLETFYFTFKLIVNVAAGGPDKLELRPDITIVAVGPHKPGVGPAEVPHDGLGKCIGSGLSRLWEWVDIGPVDIVGKLGPVVHGKYQYVNQNLWNVE